MPLRCPHCNAVLGGGIEICPSCRKPLIDLPMISAVTWTTTQTTKQFVPTCPWCGERATFEQRALTYAYRCACDAIALGTPLRVRGDRARNTAAQLR